MANIDELRAELESIHDELMALHKKKDGELREFTPAMQTRYDDLMADQTRLKEKIAQHEAIRSGAQNPARTVSGSDGNQPTEKRFGANVNYLSSGKAWQVRDGAAGDELRGRAVDALVGFDASDETIQRAADAMLSQARYPQEQNELARRIAVCASPEYARAFAKQAMDPVSGHNSWTAAERAAWDKMLEARASMSSTNSASYLVPTHLDPTIIVTNAGSSNVIRQLARVVTLPHGTTWHGVSSAGVTASYDSELQEVSDDTPTFSNPSIPVYKAQSLVQGSIEAFEDIANIQSDILMLFNDAKDRLEETKFTVGAGSTEPKGVFTAVHAVTASRVVSTTAATIGVADLKSVYRGVPARYRRRANWLANPVYTLAVKDLGTAVNASYSGDLRDPSASKWYDRPVYESDDAPSTQTTTALDDEVLFGDFSQFVIVDRLGASAEFIPHLFNTANNLPDGRRAVYFHWRSGSDVTNADAFRVLADKTTA
jgi:HK97 family phage major capsid protein